MLKTINAVAPLLRSCMSVLFLVHECTLDAMESRLAVILESRALMESGGSTTREFYTEGMGWNGQHTGQEGLCTVS